ncbi:hypothetical protein Vadar_032979 [Vaccinium darrowii]|uniref:Uncharacterized protein n=1 Tax=Vaccinium darrowii TaxID=229202 RepID=A0ACB7YIR8_9ERIC|nr:hypothetical protein Vadar_032979 [Vaccinium darrowii]
MKTASAPNLNRETTSITRITTNFFTFFQDPNHHDDTTLNKRQKIEHSEDTEVSKTSPFKDILSPILPFNEMYENHSPIDGSFYRWDRMDQTLPRWPPSPNGSDTNVSVGSNQFVGDDDVLKAWWDECNHLDFPQDKFRRAFRMSKSTFDFICGKLHDPLLVKKDTMIRLAIPVRQRLAVCIWRLATGISTCRKLVLEVCSAIRQLLMIKYLIRPDEERMKGLKMEFELVSGIPNVVGSMASRGFLKDVWIVENSGYVAFDGLSFGALRTAEFVDSEGV